MISLLALAVLALVSGVVVAAVGLARRTSVTGRRPVLLGPAISGTAGTPAPVKTSVLGDVERAQLVRRWAGLERRRLHGYLPRWLTVAVASTTVLLGALLVTTTLLGSLDGASGRAGGTLSLECVVRGSRVGSSAGPWLGRYYSLPLAVALGVVLALAAIGARAVVLRPRADADAGDRSAVDADERLRRRSAEALVAGCGVAVAATLLLAAPVTAIVMGNAAGASAYVGGRPLPSCAPAWWSTAQWSAAAAALLAVAVLVWCAAVVLVPTRRHDVAAGQR